jgi:hypothetical protein
MPTWRFFMKKTSVKKSFIFIFTAMVFLFVFAQQYMSGTSESKFPGSEKLQMLWEFDSGG